MEKVIVFVRVKKGYMDEGKIAMVLGPTVFVSQEWTPVLFEDDEDPTFFKEAGLEIIDPPKRKAARLRKRTLVTT